MMDRILGSLGIMHTKDTIVGDAFVRGVSGGERKRVSLAEVLSTNPAIACWDNPIRGLDSSSALQYLRVLQEMSRSTGMSNIVTLYQASETMYQECFDRVLVLYGGRMIYCGPARDAKQYFYDLGFECPDRQTTPDFLTAVTSPSERRFRPDYLGPRYTDQISLAKAFRESPNYQKLLTDMDSYRDLTRAPTYLDSFCEEVDRVRSRLTPRNAIEPASIPRQIAICLIRYYQLLWGDWNTLLVTVLMCAINAVITGSAYFMAPKTSIGSFEKGGALFISLIYFCLNSMTEVPKTVNARSILLKQHRLGLTHPAVYVITQAIGDIPVALLQTLVFSCCYYFMIGAVKTASNFWIFLLIIFTHYAAVASMFRMLGAWAPNLSVALLTAGSALPVICLYSGYAPTIPTMHRWGSWIRRIAPSPWALEALMGNEFEYITLHCTPSELVPSGTGYSDIQYQGCPLPGSQKGSTFVAGKEYLAEHYRFYHQNLWRNFGIILAMWAIYVILTAIGLSVMTRDSGTSGAPVYKRGAKILSENKKFTRAITEGDLEKQTQQEPQTGVPQAHLESGRISSSTSTIDRSECSSTDVGVSLRGKAPPKVFTFSNVNYFVPESGQEKQLLRDVSGFVKAGQLTALMGASGAGKTTLLDTISGRKSDGRVEGEMLLNGHPLNRAFARSCGFCQQQDVHEPKSTIREALQFSARLRQPATVSEEDKMAYVEHIISLLEMGQIADALIGEPGDGLLNVEERKRVTIGVELAAKPSTLLVLDEV
jgi:ABC-type multidrug transport system ATPase subunit/ABC-type multidrug transport system permease subunit